jgi:hypothetical protein
MVCCLQQDVFRYSVFVHEGSSSQPVVVIARCVFARLPCSFVNNMKAVVRINKDTHTPHAVTS